MYCNSDLEGRYALASETRNNLVAAAQNINGAQRYLSNVQFPYCAPPEVDTLNKASLNPAGQVWITLLTLVPSPRRPPPTSSRTCRRPTATPTPSSATA